MMAREGLAVPETTKLLYELRNLGYTLPIDALEEDECAAVVAKARK